MKLRLRLHETRETLKLELTDTDTLHDLRRRINPTVPSSVHLSLNRKDELLAPSPDDTLLSLGVTSGDLIYYSRDQSAFAASDQGEESSNWKLGDYETLSPQSESNQAVVHDSMGIGFAEVDLLQDQEKADLNPSVEDPAEGSKGETSGMEGPEPMDVEIAPAEIKRLSEPFFLKKILLEKSGDTSELTTLALSVHAVMLESGFLLLDHGSDKFNFSKELLSVSLRYSLPELITSEDTNTVESVTVRFQNIGPRVFVYGTLSGPREKVHMTNLDKHRFASVINLVLDTLKFEKESSSSFYREVFMFWRMVKDDLVIPLLIGLCDKAGLESPPCLMRLPTELKLKILESLPGVSIGNMACVCTEMRYLASDNDLWKQKCLEEAMDYVRTLAGEVNWKGKFAAFWRDQKQLILLARRNLPARRSIPRFPSIIRDPFDSRDLRDLRDPFDPRGLRDPLDPRGLFDPRDPYDLREPRGPLNPFGLHLGGGPGGRARGQRFTPGCNLGLRN